MIKDCPKHCLMKNCLKTSQKLVFKWWKAALKHNTKWFSNDKNKNCSKTEQSGFQMAKDCSENEHKVGFKERWTLTRPRSAERKDKVKIQRGSEKWRARGGLRRGQVFSSGCFSLGPLLCNRSPRLLAFLTYQHHTSFVTKTSDCNQVSVCLLSMAFVATWTRSDQSRLIASGMALPSAMVLIRGLLTSATALGDNLQMDAWITSSILLLHPC